MASRHLVKLKHDRTELGFLSASVTEEDAVRDPGWILRVESPSDAQEFRDHLLDGSSMEFSMITRDGALLRGEAYVSSISDGIESAMVAVLAGTGPLRRS